jgi:hypothetical protein
MSGAATEERHYADLTELEARLLDEQVERMREYRRVADRFVDTLGEGFSRADARAAADELFFEFFARFGWNR